jgi:beta-glucosidase
LRTAIAFGFFDREQKVASIPLDNPTGRRLARKAAEEAVVLLKNTGVLPLDLNKYKSIAVIGPNASPAVTGAGGSSLVDPFHPVSLLDGIKTLMGDEVVLRHAPGVQMASEVFGGTPFTIDPEGTKPGALGEYFNNTEMKGTPALTRVDRHIFFDWGEGSYADGQPVDEFSAHWSAYYTPRRSGSYTFMISGDDGFRLFVDDQLVISQWQYQGEAMVTRQLPLTAGRAYKIRVEYFEGTGQAKISFGISDNSREPLEKAVAAAKASDLVILSVGFNRTTEGEGADRSFELPPAQQELITQVMAANPNVIVVLNAGGNLDMSPFLAQAQAVLHAWYTGEESGTAVAEILLGQVNPSGKLPASFERRWEDNPVHDSYYDRDHSQRVAYTEGVFLGYRYYDKAAVKPLFPFGFGLSYTTFRYSDLKVSTLDKDSVRVSFVVTNTGERAGAEVAELYVSDTHPTLPRPVKELKGFARAELRPGEKRKLDIILDRRAFSYYDVASKAWKLTPGSFDILVGGSSEKIELKGSATLAE